MAHRAEDGRLARKRLDAEAIPASAANGYSVTGPGHVESRPFEDLLPEVYPDLQQLRDRGERAYVDRDGKHVYLRGTDVEHGEQVQYDEPDYIKSPPGHRDGVIV